MAFSRLAGRSAPDAVAALGCALPTALRRLDQVRRGRVGDTVVVQGAGPVGLVGGARRRDRRRRAVIVIDSAQKRLNVAEKLGATHTSRSPQLTRASSAGARSMTIVAQRSDVVVEAAGALRAFPEGVDLTGNYGRYIVLGLWGATGHRAITPRRLTTRT